MSKLTSATFIALGVLTACLATVAGQTRSAVGWTTTNGDAERTGWIPTDTRISTDGLRQPGFQFLWKLRLAKLSAPTDLMTAPVLFPTFSTFRGRKALAVLGGGGNNLYAVDMDLGELFWSAHFNDATASPEGSASMRCPGGITSSPSRPAPLSATIMPSSPVAAPGKTVGIPGSAVGEPGRGAAGWRPPPVGRSAAAPEGRAAAKGAPAGSAVLAPTTPARAGAVGLAGAGLFVVTGDGLLHALNQQTGGDLMPAVPLVSPNARANGLVVANGVAYASTAHGCGGVSDALWARNLSASVAPARAVIWEPKNASIAGTAGAAFSPNGTLFVATSQGSGPYANSVVSLDARTLTPTSAFTQPSADFNTTPVFFTWNQRDYVAASGGDGRVYLLNASQPVAGQMTSAFVTPTLASPSSNAGMLASWEDAAGERWILVPTSRHLIALKLVEVNGATTLQAGWMSRDLGSPLSPLVMNGVVFVVSNGSPRARAAARTGSASAVMYALDGLTGRELWNSGTTITAEVSGGLAGGLNQVMFASRDGTFWAFGFPIPH